VATTELGSWFLNQLFAGVGELNSIVDYGSTIIWLIHRYRNQEKRFMFSSLYNSKPCDNVGNNARGGASLGRIFVY
jgi:hypothetical protein